MSETTTITLELTKDELMILLYVLPDRHGWGDPLKDIYELESQYKHQIEKCYAAAESLRNKASPVLAAAIKATPCDCEQESDE